MPQVEFHPDAQKYAYLTGGQYGPNMQTEADCEIVEYQFPANEPPRWAKNGKAEDFAFLKIRVNQAEGPSVMTFNHVEIKEYSRCKLPEWLVSIGIPCEGETFRHDTDSVAGRKCGVEFSDARQGNDGRWFSGRLIDVMGLQ